NMQAARATAGGATESTVLGPFYVPDQPVLPMEADLNRGAPGPSVRFAGRVLGPDGAPVADARIEVWQTAPTGLYDVQDPSQPRGNLRGTFVTGSDGRYAFRTLLPSSYPIPHDGPVGQLLRAVGRHPYRPAHVHFMITAAGCRKLVTHLFLTGDQYLASDAVFGVKPSLIVVPR